MKVGDLIYHIDDWADKKPIVGIILGFDRVTSKGDHLQRVLFTDKTEPELWPERELKHVEHNEDR